MTQAKTVIVSGGSRGLGAAIVEKLLSSGYVVATFSRQSTPEIAQWSGDRSIADRFVHQELDITRFDEVEAFVHTIHDRFDGIDGLVSNAAVAHDGVLATLDDNSISQMIDVNLTATIHLVRTCVRRMLDKEFGAIVNIASTAATRGVAGLSVYSATKAGVVGFSRSLARELGPKGIRVNVVAPGYLETDMSQGLTDRQRETVIRRTPLGRLGKPEDVAPFVEFLLSDSAAYITGQVIGVDGGAGV